MNWIKGLDRIYFILSIIAFVLSLITVFPETGYMPRWAKPNPEYGIWYKEHGKKYEEYKKDIRNTSNSWGHRVGLMDRIKREEEYPFPPPNRYLPIELYKRIIASIASSIAISSIVFFGFASLTRLLNISMKWIISGFKNKQ